MKYELELGGRQLSVELRDLAEQANGNVLIQYGGTLILATAVLSSQEREVDFFPLTVDYEERYYAAGKILGSRYIRRESRPSDEAILTARLIDRAIRPRFPENFFQEVQTVITCLSWDRENDPDIIGLLGASQALSLSDIPWSGPLGVARIGRIHPEGDASRPYGAGGKFILNPTYEEREKSDLDLVLAGIEATPSALGSDALGQGNDILINMIEGEAQEMSEETILEACQFAEPWLKKVIDFQNQIAKKEGKEKIPIISEPQPEIEKEARDFLKDKLEKVLGQSKKAQKTDGVEKLREELLLFTEENHPGKKKIAKNFFEKEMERSLQKNILEKGKRPDGRKLDELRKISCEVGLLPRTHGSGLFCRGETKTLSILTLGAPGDVRLLEGMEIVGKKRFMHHYNFPPYSTGEVKPMRGPGRREIGHGMLAEKALFPLVPAFEEFPYTIRVVSEILSSNGSTSMASISSACLALMDAGVPLKSPVAGISIGLAADEKNNYKVLTDIQGPEDHYGDMDFKVAGTKKGITALQMDVKIKGVPEEILKKALSQAKKARLEILEMMAKVLEKPRPELSPLAPRILTLQINPEKIREVIGPGGKVINEIIRECGVSIDVEESGMVFVTADKEEAAKKAISWIKNITREVKVGEIFQGKVKRILDFGAFVEILPKQEGLIHISQLAPYHVRKVEDIVKMGDVVQVKVIGIDEQGRINLSLKDVENKPQP